MARFNATVAAATLTENLAGGEAYSETPELELASLLLTSFAQDQFYRSADATFAQVRGLIRALPDKRFAAQAGIFARNEYGMRSITHVCLVELCQVAKGEKWLRRAVTNAVRRPDDATEILAYQLATYGKPIPNALKRGVADALAGFDAYRLGKYKGDGHKLSLVDAVNLTHPKATPQLSALMTGTLAAPDTWEVRLTQAGSDAEAKRKVWADLLESDSLGYFALLRNLRNITAQAPDSLPVACKYLVDPERIHKSLVLPFRFFTAMRELKTAGVPSFLLGALSDAMEISLENVPALPGKTLVALDVSGSMKGVFEKAAPFAAALVKRLDSDLLLFDAAGYCNGGLGYARVAVNPRDTLSSIVEALAARFTGGGTDFRLIFAGAGMTPYDRIIILSDRQAWVGYHAPKDAHREYKARTGADPAIFSFDLQGYGTLQFPERNVYCLAGFSEKVFDVMAALQEDRAALVNKIKAVPV